MTRCGGELDLALLPASGSFCYYKYREGGLMSKPKRLKIVKFPSRKQAKKHLKRNLSHLRKTLEELDRAKHVSYETMMLPFDI